MIWFFFALQNDKAGLTATLKKQHKALKSSQKALKVETVALGAVVSAHFALEKNIQIDKLRTVLSETSIIDSGIKFFLPVRRHLAKKFRHLYAKVLFSMLPFY